MYVLYDTKDNDIVVCVGSAQEIANYLECSLPTLYCNVSRKTLCKRRYVVERVEDYVWVLLFEWIWKI